MTNDHEKQNIHRWISGYKGRYSITECGRVYSHETRSDRPDASSFSTRKGRFLKERVNDDGYNTVILTKNGISQQKFIHRLVCEAYIPNPENLSDVNHIDRIRDNNHKDNLGWLSHHDNIIYSSAKRYLVTHPCGREEKVTNMAEFCRRTGYHKSGMSELSTGKKKVYRGLMCKVTGWAYD